MKKKLTVAFISVAAAMGVCIACGDSHEHTFDEENWIGGESGHWHEATCGHDVTSKLEMHIDVDNDGECDVCEYPVDAVVSGTYYFFENGELNNQLYIKFNAGVWTDDEGLTGDYAVNIATVTLYIDVDGERDEFANGVVNGDDITLNLLGGECVYRKGTDNVPQEKTLDFELSEDSTYYTV
ncbi:MAG: hypothetical protein K2M48_00995, partial [Clostridiales bacterium]|nr:hypothetical protein [Clostridiales bacterium]